MKVCKECGSKNVQVKAWVLINKRTRFADVDFMDEHEDEDTWCPECKEHTGIIDASEFITEKE